MKGKVYLVGAGPGDPGLLTVKAARLVREADLIVYDYLANPDHLRHAKPEAVKICVGKGFRHHRISQERINRLIIASARKGQKVLRLKGGDPYLFGRGGEEALYLRRHRIPFEVVPGVTSATAFGAYAGIPLTHREHNSSVTFLTGHRAHDKNLDSVDWDKIVALNGTIVIYMGFYNLGKIIQRLLAAGLPPAAKIAVVQWGTLPRQKSCEGTLKDIEKLVARKGFGAPSIIIVGDVVALKNKLDWYERLPLFGKKIVITRMRDKAGVLREKLNELGAEVLEFPTIEIGALSDYSEMDDAIANVSDFDWLIFTSAYGVEAFFDRLGQKHKRDARWLGGVKIASVGSETSTALAKRGVSSDLQPKRFETEALLKEFKARFLSLKGKKMLLVRTNIAPPQLEEGLKKMGAGVRRVTGYLTRFPRSVPAALAKELLSGKVHFVTFTSSSTVSHFVKIMGLKTVRKIAKSARFASIGPVTSRTLRSYGLGPSCEAKVFTIDGLVEALRRHSEREARRISSLDPSARVRLRMTRKKP